jgi:hypothetical protein
MKPGICRQKKSWLASDSKPAQRVLTLRQLSTDSSDDDGGGGNNGVRCTSSMTVQNSSRSMDTAGSSHMDNSHSRMDNNRIGKPDSQIRFRLLLRQR